MEILFIVTRWSTPKEQNTVFLLLQDTTSVPWNRIHTLVQRTATTKTIKRRFQVNFDHGELVYVLAFTVAVLADAAGFVIKFQARAVAEVNNPSVVVPTAPAFTAAATVAVASSFSTIGFSSNAPLSPVVDTETCVCV